MKFEANKLRAWLLFEKPYTAYSFDDLEAVLERIQANIGPAASLRQLNPFATLPPFKGHMSRSGGVLRYSFKAPRALNCILVTTPDGTRLDGTLSLYGLERFKMVGFPAILGLLAVANIIFGDGSRDGLGKSLLSLAATLPLMALFVVFGRFTTTVWFGFKGSRERDFLDVLAKVIQPQVLLSEPTSGVRPPPKPSTPTEVFIRPRHSSNT
jgi:hypothetical protein